MKSIFDLERQMYNKGSRVNEAGNYTKPTMRKNLFNKIKAGGKGGARANGVRVKLRCLPSNIKLRAGATHKHFFINLYYVFTYSNWRNNLLLQLENY